MALKIYGPGPAAGTPENAAAVERLRDEVFGSACAKLVPLATGKDQPQFVKNRLIELERLGLAVHRNGGWRLTKEGSFAASRHILKR